MWTEEEMIQYLKDNLKESRFYHSLSVRDTAIKLAKVYKQDESKSKIAGLIHDCAKYVKSKDMLDISRKCGYNLNGVCLTSPSILHGPVAAYIAKKVMQVTDEDILNAITYHTTGRKNMSILEKIIYLADYIEPLRDFPGVDKVRNLAYKGYMDKALIFSFDNTIKYIIENGWLLHSDTIEARNFILCNR